VFDAGSTVVVVVVVVVVVTRPAQINSLKRFQSHDPLNEFLTSSDSMMGIN